MISLLPGLLLALAPVEAAVTGSASSSSNLRDDEGVRHVARRAMDGLLKTGWAEGEAGSGDGQWIEINLGRLTEVQEVSIWPGNLVEGARSYREYCRPRNVRISLLGGAEDVVLDVQIEDRMHRADIPIEGQARRIRVDIVDAYDGIVFADLFVAEVAVNFNHSRARLQGLMNWLDSDAASRAHEAHEARIREAYTSIQESEFGDEESLAFLMDQAGEGPDFIRSRVRQMVDAGYLAAAIRPDPDGVEALRKLKDPNGIPALELAALRLSGDRAEEMQEVIEYFYAYQTFLGGARRNIPNWGTTGWELGGLQSFDEPISIEVDREGAIYLADVGNHRVQRFGPSGAAERQWGPAAGITDEWFRPGRTFYVSGAAPGSGAGEFVTPLDVELIPGREADGFAVLDAAGRVQIFDAEGQGVIGWTVEHESRLDPGVGGEGYLAYSQRRDRLFVILGRDFVGYTLDGEEVARAVLEDGTPNAVEMAPRGYLLMAYGREVIRYDLDGFRYGVVLDEEDLGIGFEDMDLTYDEEGRLWVVTDRGWAHKFKRPGKHLYSVQFEEDDLLHPRVAVREGIIYCVERDRILRLDAIQAKLDAEAEENP